MSEAKLDIIRLFCPDCGGDTKQDHNSFWCYSCRGLWPKLEDGYWEDQGKLRRREIMRLGQNGGGAAALTNDETEAKK